MTALTPSILQADPAPIWRHFAMRKTCVVFSEKVGRTTLHNWPSNFFVEPDGSCVESEFQAVKVGRIKGPWMANVVRRWPPGKAKWYGRRGITLDRKQQAHWNNISYDVMYALVLAKFSDWPDLAELLLATEDGMIVEENWWHDDTWGHCTCRDHYWKIGKNQLGQILMDVRGELGGVPAPAPRTWGNFVV